MPGKGGCLHRVTDKTSDDSSATWDHPRSASLERDTLDKLIERGASTVDCPGRAGQLDEVRSLRRLHNRCPHPEAWLVEVFRGPWTHFCNIRPAHVETRHFQAVYRRCRANWIFGRLKLRRPTLKVRVNTATASAKVIDDQFAVLRIPRDLRHHELRDAHRAGGCSIRPRGRLCKSQRTSLSGRNCE